MLNKLTAAEHNFEGKAFSMDKLSTRVVGEVSQDANQLDDKGTPIESPKMRPFLLGLGALVGAAVAEMRPGRI